jgi:small subunit ribosomal protein S3
LRADIDYGFAEAHTTYGVIGIKTWIYKGEILDLTKRRGLLPEPEPRRDLRDRRDRGDRPRRDRGEYHGPAATQGPVSAAPVPEVSGPAMQTPPADLPRPAVRAATPILPPLMSPQQPAWKQEARPEAQPEAQPEAPPQPEEKPAASDKPEPTGENQ